MREFGFKVTFGKKEEKTVNEKDMQSMIATAEALATLIDSKMMEKACETGIEDEYLQVLERIWDYTEDGNYELAMEILYVMAMVLDEDSKVILKNLIYPHESAVYYFLDYFCEYLVDAHIIDDMIYKAELKKMREEFFEEEEEEETEEPLDIAYAELKNAISEGEDKDE